MEEREQLKKIKESLCEFIIRSTKEDAPDYAVQVLSEAIDKYIQLSSEIM